MAWSITLTVDARGKVEVTATDCLGGCPYHVAARPEGGLEGLSNVQAARKVRTGLQAQPNMEDWSELIPAIREAAVNLILCLPPAERFDENGRPT